MPLADLRKIQAVVTGTAEEVAAGLVWYVAAGARHLVPRLGAIGLRAQEQQLDDVAALLPALRAAASRYSQDLPPTRAHT
jgi:hypothetical protein